MGLDISVKVKTKIVCPKCGDVVGYETLKEFEFCGRELMDLVYDVGYQESDYGRFIMLDDDGIKALANCTDLADRYGGEELVEMAKQALRDGKYVFFFEADW